MSSRTVPCLATCGSCRHYLGVIAEGPGAAPDPSAPIPLARIACEAFPAGIPEAIYTGRRGHRSRVRGDRGIVYAEVVKSYGTAPADALWGRHRRRRGDITRASV